MTVMTKVRVKDLPLLADIGINPDEIGRRQPLVITVQLLLDGGAVDAIGETVDYRRIVRAAEAMSEVHIPLIETFAHRLGAECLSWPGVIEACVNVDKPFALTRGLAGVEVTVRG
ncbi:dihydroneopterin aldolase [Sphingobium sp. CAP-1]|uniref:dihydroneopterin aldolase n=1 Tax=Sphingobium sp. CAP-1 TaxID=2676077 RepID=UPI0012BB3CCF|nr:dihydroneopterin aldolase [Sphingobium sp. CAP-1]QGP80395.1 dihydroneopterin aldolase [Sphingobium sp. CAP-1]